MKKKIIDPSRIRRIPSQFSWVDHRLIRHRRLSGRSSQAWALYLFLVTVADAEGLSITFREADAEALPFADGSFDVVVSTFGVMFTPDQDRAAAELVRVCRRGGKIGLANWTPEGFIGQLFKTIGKHLPPPPGAKSPALWGTRTRIAEMFEAHASSIKSAQRNFTFRYHSAEHWLEVFKTYYGPVLKTFAALDPAKQTALESDLRALIAQFNRSGDGTMVVPSEYLEIVITRN
jgi:ubiquinone/menaquinone biosynthesis C-methylase UbiE